MLYIYIHTHTAIDAFSAPAVGPTSTEAARTWIGTERSHSGHTEIALEIGKENSVPDDAEVARKRGLKLGVIRDRDALAGGPLEQ